MTATSATPGFRDRVFNLFGTYPFPADLDRVVGSTDKIEEPFLVFPELVSGVEDDFVRALSWPEGSGGENRIVPITAHDVGPAHD
jgi:hypothetical protein